jgi:heme O synthase-like polyprenyltransferase
MIVYATALLPISLLLVPLGLGGILYLWSALIAGFAYAVAAVLAANQPNTRTSRTLLLTSVLHLPALLGSLLLEKVFA